MQTKYDPHFSLANQVIIQLTSLSPGVEGGEKKSKNSNQTAWHMVIHSGLWQQAHVFPLLRGWFVCGRGWERVLGLPPLICEAWMFLEPFPHHIMEFLHLFPPHFQTVSFLFHVLGTSFLGTEQRQLLEFPMTFRTQHI